MATNTNSSDKVRESNLPLLFVKGNPTSLELMNLEELQVFLRFVIKCEGNRTEWPDLDEIEQPKWWPKGFEFSETIMMKQEKQRGKLSLLLKNAIRQCYTFHECAFLIDFCRQLIVYTGGVENLQVVDNKDGTRCLLRRKDKKLLVTFKAENQDYDREKKGSKKESSNKFSKNSPMKTLDSRRLLRTLPAPPTSDPAMSHCVTELYLCDNCEKSFDSLPIIMDHERTCAKKVEKVEPSVQEKIRHSALLNYLRLGDKNQKPPARKKLKESERPRASSYEKFIDIDLSSPLGNYIITSSRLRLDQLAPGSRSMRGVMTPDDYNNQLESKCPGTIAALRGSNAYADIRTKFQNVFKLTNAKKRTEAWVHHYSFNKKQRLARYRDLRRGLTFPSYRLWRKTNRKSLEVKLKRMTGESVSFYMHKYKQRMARLELMQNSETADHQHTTSPTTNSIPTLTELRIQTLESVASGGSTDSSPANSPRRRKPGPKSRTQPKSRKLVDGAKSSKTSSATASPTTTTASTAVVNGSKVDDSPITIETSDSEVEEVGLLTSVQQVTNHLPTTSFHNTQIENVHIQMYQPQDEFAPILYNSYEERTEVTPKRSPLVTSSTTNVTPHRTTNHRPVIHRAIVQGSRFEPASPMCSVPSLSPVNRSGSTKKQIKHVPNIILKTKQSLFLQQQLNAAKVANSDVEEAAIFNEMTPQEQEEAILADMTPEERQAALFGGFDATATSPGADFGFLGKRGVDGGMFNVGGQEEARDRLLVHATGRQQASTGTRIQAGGRPQVSRQQASPVGQTSRVHCSPPHQQKPTTTPRTETTNMDIECVDLSSDEE